MSTRAHPVEAVVMVAAFALSVLIPTPVALSPSIESVCAAIATAAFAPLALFIVFCFSDDAEWSPRDAVEVSIAITRGCFVALACVLSLSSTL